MKKLFFLLLCFTFLLVFLSPVALSTEQSFAIENPLTVRVGVYENAPKIFTDKDGKATGFWAEITEYIAKEEGWNIEWVHGNWQECLQMLENGEIDIMPDVAYSDERGLLYDFANEVLVVSWSRIYTAKGVFVQSILDLDGKTIAVLKGSVNVEGPEGIKALTSSFGIECTFTEKDSYLAVFETLNNGNADAAVVSKDFGDLHEKDYNIDKTQVIFAPSKLFFAFTKGGALTPSLIEAVDTNIIRLKSDADSAYYDLLQKWFEGTEEREVIPGWVAWIALAFVLAIILLFGGNYYLRAQVNSRTKELTEEVLKRKQAEEDLRQSYGKLGELVKERTIELKEKTDALEEANAHLREVNRHKSVFLANMSHELRTPLNSIIGYTKLMYDGLDGEINEEQKQDLLAVYSNGKILLELINGLLDLSKIEAGKIVMAYEVFAVSNLVNEVITTVQPLAVGKGLSMSYNIDNTIDNIYADRAKIRQVLVNILGNAVKFTSEGGIELEIVADKDNYIFSITDTGIGIVKENLEAIFDSFVQVGPAQIAGYAGTGLGLAVCRQFIEMQGGKIWAESELGKGSKFIFTLPMNKRIILNSQTGG